MFLVFKYGWSQIYFRFTCTFCCNIITIITPSKAIFNGKWHITYWAEVRLNKCFQICCHNFDNNLGLIGRNVNIIITMKLKLFPVFIRQDIFVLACFSCCSNSLTKFFQSAIHRLLLASHRYCLSSSLSLIVMAYHLSQWKTF